MAAIVVLPATFLKILPELEFVTKKIPPPILVKFADAFIKNDPSLVMKTFDPAIPQLMFPAPVQLMVPPLLVIEALLFSVAEPPTPVMFNVAEGVMLVETFPLIVPAPQLKIAELFTSTVPFPVNIPLLFRLSVPFTTRSLAGPSLRLRDPALFIFNSPLGSMTI